MPKTLTKTEIVDAIAKGAGIPKIKADAALSSFVDAIVTNVAKGNTVRVPQLGTWKRQPRKARTGRNPRTGAAVKIAATKVPKFTASTGFKDNVSGKPAPKPKARKPAARKTAARKPAARKTAARKPAARATAAKKAPAKKAPAKKAPAKKAPARRATATRSR